jgi:hypothetical protein
LYCAHGAGVALVEGVVHVADEFPAEPEGFFVAYRWGVWG